MGDKAVKKALQNNSEVIEKENSVSQQTKKQSQTTNSGSWRLKKGKAIYNSRIFYFCATKPHRKDNETVSKNQICEQTDHIKVLWCLFLGAGPYQNILTQKCSCGNSFQQTEHCSAVYRTLRTILES